MKHGMVEATYPSDENVRNYYSWRASIYDAGAGFEFEHHAEALRLAAIKEGSHVLDVACGTGRATTGLAKTVRETGTKTFYEKVYESGWAVISMIFKGITAGQKD